MSFQAILGHKQAIRGLQSTVQRDRVSHAYLFSGPDGIGKEKIARAFAALLNCEQPIDGPDACGTCRACRQMSEERHPDLHALEPDGRFIKIDAVREMCRKLRYKPMSGRWRIILIREADRLHEAAANALLKTLEEPTPGNIFLLLSSQTHSLLATIRSRCQHVRCTTLPTNVVSQWLEEQRDIEPQTAAKAAAMSWGSIGYAERLTDPVLMALRTRWLSFISEATQLNPPELLEWAEEFAKEKEMIQEILDTLRVAIRDMVIRSATGQTQHCAFPSHLESLPPIPVEQGLLAMQALAEAETSIQHNVNARLTAEHLLLTIRDTLKPEAHHAQLR